MASASLRASERRVDRFAYLLEGLEFKPTWRHCGHARHHRPGPRVLGDPRSWEHWIAHYEAKGFTVLAPAYPGFEVEVEALNKDPSPIEAVTVSAIIEHLESVVGALEKPPILIGHSAGGVFTQILLDHGFGAAGVAINSAPTEGVKRVALDWAVRHAR
jgi:esterase/lipase